MRVFEGTRTKNKTVLRCASRTNKTKNKTVPRRDSRTNETKNETVVRTSSEIDQETDAAAGSHQTLTTGSQFLRGNKTPD